MNYHTRMVNRHVPVPAQQAHVRMWYQVGTVLAFRGGLSIEITRHREGDNSRLLFVAREGGASATLSPTQYSSFGVGPGCTLVTRAISYSDDVPGAVLIELQADPEVLPGAVKVAA